MPQVPIRLKWRERRNSVSRAKENGWKDCVGDLRQHVCKLYIFPPSAGTDLGENMAQMKKIVTVPVLRFNKTIVLTGRTTRIA